MVGGDGEDEWVVEERGGGHQRMGNGFHDERQVNLPAGQLEHQLAGSGLDHQQLDPRVVGVELDQGRSKDPRDQAGGGADGKPSAGHPGEGPGFGAGGFHVGQDAADERKQGFTVGGERHQTLTGPAVEQHHSQLPFEQADLAAQRGLRQVQAGGRPGEVPFFGHRQRVGQLVQLHL